MPVYHMTWADLRKVLEFLKIKTLTDLCAVHITVTGYRLCEPKTMYNQLSENGELSMTLSRSIYMLKQNVTLSRQLEKVQENEK
ncbi:MAG: hypothetical protein PQ612_06400 [Rickettsiales bacterium]|nr:hypothetical protein [Pseudomonadota bacterium]MDA0966602.1 hypothetical protein [Pseudomonadota bacterium]MDG4543631.1 hypothetical protein [Rickettsiales bacterium]MDG4545778.1 hypothetical protein [Rickettsiales bacterium]MDG4547449.1 hypothetical protein [Rickettsiales bacterium]